MGRYKGIRLLVGMVSLILFMAIPLTAKADVKTGGIKISLLCSEEVDGNRIELKRTPEMVPLEKSSYIVSVRNEGDDAWVRLKVDYLTNHDENPNEITPEDCWLKGIGENWEKIGAYWYYKKPLNKKESVDFCEAVEVPDITNLPRGMEFEIALRAEAIQAAHIVPDFSSQDPFLGFLIEGSIVNGELENRVAGFQVMFENGADTILHTDRLFEDVEILMPGDEKRHTVKVLNRNPYHIRVLLKEEGNYIGERLGKVLNLTIEREGKKLYDGPLADPALKNGLVLGEYKRNVEEELVFILSLSENAGNDTAFQQIDLTMIFHVEAVKKEREYDETSKKPTEKKESVNMHPYPDPTQSKGYMGGMWKLIDEKKHLWEYYFSDGSQAKSGWLFLYNPYSPDADKNGWFCFDENGRMQYGWIKTENENWYFCHEISDGNLGRLKKSWHLDADDARTYYLDPVTGIMQSGWREIDGKYYYFTPLEETYRQNWFWNTRVGRWLYDFLGYRTYGSMFRAEQTPDGYQVDRDGCWLEDQ